MQTNNIFLVLKLSLGVERRLSWKWFDPRRPSGSSDNGLFQTLPCWMELAPGSVAAGLPRKLFYRFPSSHSRSTPDLVLKRSGTPRSILPFCGQFCGLSGIKRAGWKRKEGSRGGKATDDRRIVYVSFWIFHNESLSVHT